VILLIIGDMRVRDASFLSWKQLNELKRVRISEQDAARGRTFPMGKDGQCLRELLGHEPTEVVCVIMPMDTWTDSGSIVNAQSDYFTACTEMWALHEDGTQELVRGDGG
jgi:hypothetical protein